MSEEDETATNEEDKNKIKTKSGEDPDGKRTLTQAGRRSYLKVLMEGTKATCPTPADTNPSGLPSMEFDEVDEQGTEAITTEPEDRDATVQKETSKKSFY